MAEYQDFGALWLHENLEDYVGTIYGVRVCLRQGVQGEKLPAYHIFSPDGMKDIGALWNKTSKNNGTPYLSGSITVDGQKRPVALWPAKRNHERSPHWRVMPPREQAPQPAPAGQQMPTDGDELDESIPF